MSDRQRKVFAIGVLLAGLGVNALTQLAGCIYKPDAVVKLEIGGKPSAVSHPPLAGKDNRRDAGTTGAASQPAADRLETGATGDGSADGQGLKADGFSEADRMAIEAAARVIGGAR